MTFEEFAKKKVAGVPVLYLAGAFVIILGVIAWRMKPTAEDAVVDPEPTTEETDPLGGAGSDYSGLATQGTVTVVQGTQNGEQEAKEETNEDWERAAVAFLVSDKNASPTDAQAAISKYLDGADLSYDEGQLKNAAVAKLGLPPERLSNVGTVGTAPAQKQFSLVPGKHTVKGPNDNTPAKLAMLYWGKNDPQKIVSTNYKLGPVGTTYAPGTVVHISSWYEPRYFTVTKTTTYPSQLAAKNGIPYDQVIALNPGLIAPYKVGSRVRIG